MNGGQCPGHTLLKDLASQHGLGEILQGHLMTDQVHFFEFDSAKLNLSISMSALPPEQDLAPNSTPGNSGYALVPRF